MLTEMRQQSEAKHCKCSIILISDFVRTQSGRQDSNPLSCAPKSLVQENLYLRFEAITSVISHFFLLKSHKTF